jgi:hypothetical protein
VKPSGSPERFDFITSNKIKVCSKCGLVLPINDFNGHKAAFKGWEDCTGIGAIQSQISPGKSLPIEMAILHNPLDQLEAIQGLLIRLSQKDKTIDRDQTKWLYELKEHIAVNIDPHEWVSQMITNLRIFKIIFSCEAPNTNELVFLSKNLRFYEEGLKFIFGSFDIFKQRGK